MIQDEKIQISEKRSLVHLNDFIFDQDELFHFTVINIQTLSWYQFSLLIANFQNR